MASVGSIQGIQLLESFVLLNLETATITMALPANTMESRVVALQAVLLLLFKPANRQSVQDLVVLGKSGPTRT